MKKLLLLFLIISTISFASVDKYFEIKSGQIEMLASTTFNGFVNKSKQSVQFKDYGKKLSIRTSGKQNLGVTEMKIDTSVLVNDNESFLLDHHKKIYSTLTKEEVDEYNFYEKSDSGKLLGKEKILGKLCEIREIQDEDIIIKQWLWKGVPLKIIATAQTGFTMESVAVSFDIKTIPDSVFEVPANYTEGSVTFDIAESIDMDSLKKGLDSFSDEDKEKVKDLMSDLKSLFE